MSFVRAVFTSQLTIESEMDEEILSLQNYHEEEIISLTPPNQQENLRLSRAFIPAKARRFDFSWRWRRLTRHLTACKTEDHLWLFGSVGQRSDVSRMRVKHMTMPGKIANKGTRKCGVRMQFRTKNASIAIDARIDLCRAEHS